jgi:hypothetical protein
MSLNKTRRSTSNYFHDAGEMIDRFLILCDVLKKGFMCLLDKLLGLSARVKLDQVQVKQKKEIPQMPSSCWIQYVLPFLRDFAQRSTRGDEK